jgi:large subunit ribosomal protein L17
MKKNVFGRKLKRDKNERKALFKSLMSSLVLHEKIETTEAKAKAIRAEIDKLVTKAKQGGNSANLVLEKSLSRPAFDKIIKEIGPRFSKRQGGYTRLIKLGKRFGDDAPVVILEWVEKAEIISVPAIKDNKKIKEPKRVQKRVTKKKVEKKKVVNKPVAKKTAKK